MAAEDRVVKTSQPGRARPAEEGRDRGVRAVRHLSNWTVAAMVAGVGVTTAVLARSTPPTGAPAGNALTGGSTVTGGSTGAGGIAGAWTASPVVHRPVAVTTPSGVVIQSAGATGASATKGVAGPETAGRGRVVYYRGDT